jgi:trans-aconitate methyltransferase
MGVQMSFLGYIRRSIKKYQVKYFHSNEKYWKKRGLENIKTYWDSYTDERKKILVDTFRPFNCESFFEIGCNCGPNLMSLNRYYPKAFFSGCDISREAIEYGNMKLKELGIENISLLPGELSEIATNDKYDIVFTWATLIYVKPNDLVVTIKKMFDMANKAIILFEMHTEENLQPNDGILSGRNWKRNYRNLFSECGLKGKIEIKPLSKDIWNPGGGGASIITFIKE